MDFILRLSDFLFNHYILSTLFIVIALLLVFLEMSRGGKVVSPAEMTHLINVDKAAVVDVRDEKSFARGHIVDALNIPHSSLKKYMNKIESLKDKPIVLVDEMGQHSGFVGKELKKQGFSRVFRLKSGISSWHNDNLPLVTK